MIELTAAYCYRARRFRRFGSALTLLGLQSYYLFLGRQFAVLVQ